MHFNHLFNSSRYFYTYLISSRFKYFDKQFSNTFKFNMVKIKMFKPLYNRYYIQSIESFNSSHIKNT